jgi:hypothetical protein
MPASANFGAHSEEVLPPAEKIATAGIAAMPSSMPTTLYALPLYMTSLPTERADATGINSVMGKFLSANTCNIFVPTSPVAPTTATFIFYFLLYYHDCRKTQSLFKDFKIISVFFFKSYALKRRRKRKKPSILLEGF